MRGKLMFLGGMAVGFVLGARAGRERYDQLVASARKWWDHPTVQEAAGMVQAQANRLYQGGREAMGGKLGGTRFGERMGDKNNGRGESGHSSARSSSGSAAKSSSGGKSEGNGRSSSASERDTVAGGKRPPGSTF